METQTTTVRVTELIVIMLTLTIICGLIGKGVHFLYYETEKSEGFGSKKMVVKMSNKD